MFELPNDFKILLLQGGATFQNSLIPFNIGLENSIGCLVNGTWGQKTYEDFSKINNETVLFDANKEPLDTFLDNNFSYIFASLIFDFKILSILSKIDSF